MTPPRSAALAPASAATPAATPPRRHGITAAGVWSVGPAGAARRRIAGLPATFLQVLARLGAAFPLSAIGLVGDDDEGRKLVAEVRQLGIDTRQLRIIPGGVPTARAGAPNPRDASALLGPSHFDLLAGNTKILHVGRPLGLPGLDAPEPRVGTGWDVLCRQARTAGVRISLSATGGDPAALRAMVGPLLPLLNYLFLDADAAAALSGRALRTSSGVLVAEVEAAARQLLEAGVARWVVIHHPNAAFAANPEGFTVWQPTVVRTGTPSLPSEAVADAFAAGTFFAVHDHWPMDEALKVGVSAAAAFALAGGAEAVPPLNETVALGKKLGFHAAVVRGRGSL